MRIPYNFALYPICFGLKYLIFFLSLITMLVKLKATPTNSTIELEKLYKITWFSCTIAAHRTKTTATTTTTTAYVLNKFKQK